MENIVINYIDRLFDICAEKDLGHPDIDWHNDWLSAEFYIQSGEYSVSVEATLIPPENRVWIMTGCSDLICDETFDLEMWNLAREKYDEGSFVVNTVNGFKCAMGVSEVLGLDETFSCLGERIDRMIQNTLDAAKQIGKQKDWFDDGY